MTERCARDLELDKVLSMVKAFSLSDNGRAAICGGLFTSDIETISRRAERIESIIERLVRDEVHLSSFVSIQPLFDDYEAGVPDFDGQDIYSLSDYVLSLKDLARFEADESLCDKSLSDLGAEIGTALNPDGSVKETHPLLRPLFRALDNERSNRHSYTASLMGEKSSLFQSHEAVFRNHRVVLPVKREKRSELAGYVQGSSASGGTLFIEPFELVELNNRVSLAEDEIVKMKRKILSDFSVRIRRIIPQLRQSADYVTDFDIHYSFACFIRKTKSSRTVFSSSIDIKDARHPLLGESAVPVSLHVDENVRVVVLSGANAGGKTVTMKTVALFVILSQICGFAPFSEGSSLILFNNVFTDIGDGQSITENYSTFSSHMANIASICRQSDERSLVLLDEIGSGTDPSEGAALTDSLLDYFKKKGSLLFITSHYAQVKMHAYSDSGMMNASMEFDESTDMPTFRVIQGLPGESHAISTARKMGLPAEVIKNARSNIDSSSSVSQLIASLNGKSRSLDRKITELALEKKHYEKLSSSLEDERDRLEKEILRYRKTEGTELDRWLKDARKRLEKLVMDVSTGRLTKEKTRAVKEFIKEAETKKKENDRSVSDIEEKRRSAVRCDYRPGDEVLCGTFSRRGVILSDLGKGRYQVSIDAMRITLNAEDLMPAPSEKKAAVSSFQSAAKRPELSLDLRGKTLEEAVKAVDDEIEACLLHSLSSFSIIHGYGNGVLSQGLHAHLKTVSAVKDYYFANPDDGGMGKTYVLLG